MRRAWPKNSQARVPWLMLLAVAAAGVWLLAQHFKAAVVVRVIASAATLALPVLADQLIKSVFKRDDELKRACLTHLRGYSRRRGIPTVQSVRDMTTLGVTAARGSAGGEMSPYLVRDKDRNLDDLLLTSNTFVLLIGDSKAGKSRMAAEAMRRHFPGRNLIIPDNADSLGALLDAGLDFAGSVVWLDELQRYLEKSGLGRLLDYLAGSDAPRDVTILATIREKAYTTYMPDGEIESPYWAVLKRAARLRLDRLLSDTERQRATAMFNDSHLLAALDRFGLAEYLSAGPDLMERLENGIVAEPIGAMVVLAAADWSRTGVTQPVPQAVLVALVKDYAERSQVKQPGPTDINTGMAWAQKPVYGASQLLSPAQGGFTVFDYVLDHAPQNSIPGEVWDAAISAAQGEELVHVGLAAYEQNQLDIAVRVFEVIVRQETPPIDRTLAAYNYARILEKLGRTPEALEYYSKAADAGHIDAACAAGRILEARGDLDEARQYYETAAQAGSLDAAYALGTLLRETDPAQALPWLTKAARAGHREAAYAAGRMLEASGNPDEAKRYYAMAAADRPGNAQLAPMRSRPVAASADRGMREMYEIADRATLLENQFATYSNGELRERAASLRRRVENHESLDGLVPEAFAVLREAASRVSGLRCNDADLIGAVALHRGYIARMHRGEGYGETAMLAAYVNALTGDPVHVLTADNPAAWREVQRLGKLYGFLGTAASAVIDGMTVEARKVAYQSPIVYVSAEEASFDYLRDGMAWADDERVQRGLHYAIVHEADSAMIDDAFQPYQISSLGDSPSRWYTEFAKISQRLRPGADYDVDAAARRVMLTEQGIARVENWLGIDNLYDAVNSALVKYADVSLEAKELYQRDKNYVVIDGQVMLRDETGRINPGLRAYGGVHQALEAKEGVPINPDHIIQAEIHRWAFLNLYRKLSGLTSTSADIVDTFQQLYEVKVCEIPADRPRNLTQRTDLVFYNDSARWPALAELAARKHATGQPVLIDVTSDEQGNTASRILAERDIPHTRLTLQQASEDGALADAARKGAVTVGTDLYRYSADIRLGGASGTQQDHDDVAALGGLTVIGVERRGERRADDRLCEMTAQCGDPGESVFMVSRHGGALGSMIRWPAFDFGVGDLPISNALVDRAMRSVQRTTALVNDEKRQRKLRYLKVFERQRAEITALRAQILDGTTIDELARDWMRQAVDSLVAEHMGSQRRHSADVDALNKRLRELMGTSIARLELDAGGGDAASPAPRPDPAHLKAEAHAIAQRAWDERAAGFGMDLWIEIERRVALAVIDRNWREHMVVLNELSEASQLSSLTARDPFFEYQNNADDAFRELLRNIIQEFVGNMMNLIFEVTENPIVEETGTTSRPLDDSAPATPLEADGNPPESNPAEPQGDDGDQPALPSAQ